MIFTYKEIKKCIKDLGTLELYDLESTIRKEFRKRNSDRVIKQTEKCLKLKGERTQK